MPINKKKNKIGVLLNGWGGFAGPSIIDCLRKNFEKRKIRIICTDIIDKPLFHFKSDKFYILPKGNSKNYLRSLIKLCEKEKIDVIMPGSAPEILSISKNLDILQSKNIYATISEYSIIQKTLDKKKIYETLDKKNIPIPAFFHVKTEKEFYSVIKKLGYPRRAICFKPSSYLQSGGARGFRILRSNNKIENIILHNKPGSIEIDFDTTKRLMKNSKNLDLLVMEFLPGKEYSVYVFADKGKMLYCVPNLREKLEQSYSFEASISQNHKINSICAKIVRELNLSYNVNIQLKESRNGVLKVVEINPRMGGSIVLPTAAGVNLPYLGLKLALGEKIPKNLKIKKTKMIRYWKELFVNNSGSFDLS